MAKQTYMIFYDRGYRAQDNGECLCRWVMKNHPEVKTGYILNSDSGDWERLTAEGFNMIDLLDRPAVRKELLACDFACSSIFNEGIGLDFSDCHCKRVFLNHGCFLAPISYVKNEHDRIDLFIAANRVEYNTLLNPYHELQAEQVALCGQPRHDALAMAQRADHAEDSILVQFWQRPWTWTQNNDEEFLHSTFYEKTCELLTNEKILRICKENGLKLVFKMHPIQFDWLKYYERFENDVVKISPQSDPFEPEFIRSKLIITDISSNAYEMAKIGKPCIYFEPDPDELFSWRYRKNGGFEFNLAAKSIGPIVLHSVDKLADELENLVKNDYKLDTVYLNRRAEQISFKNDTGNCARCFDAIMKLRPLKSRQTNKANKTVAFGDPNAYLYF